MLLMSLWSTGAVCDGTEKMNGELLIMPPANIMVLSDDFA